MRYEPTRIRISPTEDAYSSRHMVMSPFGLDCVIMLRPVIPEVFMFWDFECQTFLVL